MYRGFEAGLRKFVQELSGVRFGVGVRIGVIGFWAKGLPSFKVKDRQDLQHG